MTPGRAPAGPSPANLRDLGGYRSGDGWSVREGLVYRSCVPRRFRAAEARFLADSLGIRTFVDLRAEDELAPAGPPAGLAEAGIRWRHASLAGSSAEFSRIRVPGPADYARSYLGMLALAGPPMEVLLGTIARGQELPLAFGCTLGKDRTGVVAALLLDLLGVPASRIAADYVETGRALQGKARDFAGLARSKRITLAELTRRLRPSRRTMSLFLDEVHRRGGAEAYLRSRGISGRTIDGVRRRLLW